MPKVAKKQVKAREAVDRTKKYTLEEACTLVKKAAPSKFDETVDLAVRLGVNARSLARSGGRVGRAKSSARVPLDHEAGFGVDCREEELGEVARVALQRIGNFELLAEPDDAFGLRFAEMMNGEHAASSGRAARDIPGHAHTASTGDGDQAAVT